MLYPITTKKHQNHVACLQLINSLRTQDAVFVLNTHLIAEMYSNLTRTPSLKIKPDEARKVIRGLAGSFELIELNTSDYLRAVDRCADHNLISGVIYDALHVEAAIKAKVDVLYTANIRDFQRLLTDEVNFSLKSPF